MTKFERDRSDAEVGANQVPKLARFCSTLPQSLLTEVMGQWQRHEGAMRLILWLLFKLRLGQQHRMTIRTLLQIAYGEARLTEAMTHRGAHKRLMKTFERDLETLYYYGLKPIFDPAT